MYDHKVLLNTFPMNGYVCQFDHSEICNFWDSVCTNCYIPPPHRNPVYTSIFVTFKTNMSTSSYCNRLATIISCVPAATNLSVKYAIFYGI
jgi:hypothetical protein